MASGTIIVDRKNPEGPMRAKGVPVARERYGSPTGVRLHAARADTQQQLCFRTGRQFSQRHKGKRQAGKGGQ